MEEFLHEISSLPTMVFTVLMGVVVLYWLSVIIGAFDVDLLGEADVDADVDIDVDVDADVDVHVDGHVDVDADADLHAGGGIGGFGAFLAAFKLTKVPLTVMLSLLFLWTWLLVAVGMHYIEVATGLPRWGVGLIVVPGGLIVGLMLTSVCIRPLIPLFRSEGGQKSSDLIGMTCVVTTGRVDLKFGEARCKEAGGLQVSVRCDEPNALTRGDEALIVDYEPGARVFRVEPLQRLLDGPEDT